MDKEIQKDRATAKQELFRWPCPLPSGHAITGLWHGKDYESKVYRKHTVAHGRSRDSLTSCVYGLLPTVAIPVPRLINIDRPSRLEPQTFPNRDVCSRHTVCNALLTELRDRHNGIKD